MDETYNLRFAVWNHVRLVNRAENAESLNGVYATEMGCLAAERDRARHELAVEKAKTAAKGQN